MPPDKSTPSHSDTNISIGGDVVDSAVIVGDNNTVNQTFIQKFINIFKSDAETLEQRNRRILLSHVETAWIKGVLDASLYGAAMLDLGIKNSPESITDKYPWTLKKEATDETLPAGTSMLEIFDSIGMGRSLLILGAPGSGKTTMLLELARGLIARAREDVTQPIPMVFNLASWTEKLTLTDWLAQELNNLYSVPRKTAPDWVKGNKLFLLLDGLDEVRQESRAKCVEAINEFRKQNGLTSLAVCSRSQDYADLKAKLSFEGAIEVQPLTQGQIAEFFNRFGEEMAGIKQVLEKDSGLLEMAETPLFLSIMLMAFRDKQDVDILVSQDDKAQYRHLFNNYIERMFEHLRAKNETFQKQDVLRWVSWLSCQMVTFNQISYFLESMQSDWLDNKRKSLHKFVFQLITLLITGFISGLIIGLIVAPSEGLRIGLVSGVSAGLIFGLMFGWIVQVILQRDASKHNGQFYISTVDSFSWNWRKVRTDTRRWLIIGFGVILGLIFGLHKELTFVLGIMLTFFLFLGLNIEQVNQITYPGQRLVLTVKSSLFAFLLFGLIFGLSVGLARGLFAELDFFLRYSVGFGLIIGMMFGLYYGGLTLIQHYTLRFILARNNILPWRLVPFLDHCVDLIFLRRVGGGYIFIHRLLMEHFAEMYKENNA